MSFKNIVIRSFLTKDESDFESILISDLHRLSFDARYLTSSVDRFVVHSENNFEAQSKFFSGVDKYEMNFRRWINENPDELTSIEIGERLKAFAKENKCSFEALDTKEVKKLGLNLLYEVGKASDLSPPRLYLVGKNLKQGANPLVLVGKAITFDTGGVNVKHHDNFVNCMKNDMGGGAMAANQFMAMVEGGYQGPILLVIPACENLVAAKSMKPGSIIKSFKGTDVIIEHTDAEGRLILADALAYAETKYTACKTILFATLTTAALRQFSGYYTPVHFADKTLRSRLEKKAASTGENFTFWNELRVFSQANQKEGIGLTNIGSLKSRASIGGGSNVAAHFCKHFCSGPYVHFDIFGSGWNWSDDYPGAHYGATGAGFHSIYKTLIEE